MEEKQSTSEFNNQMELAQIQFQLKQIELENARIAAQLKNAQMQQEERLENARIAAQVELARIELEKTKIAAQLEKFRMENERNQENCIFRFCFTQFSSFKEILEICRGANFEDCPNTYISNYIGDRRSTIDFANQNDSETGSEITTIQSQGGTKLQKVKATDFKVNTVKVSVNVVTVNFFKLQDFNKRVWFMNNGDSYDDFMKTQVGYLNTLRAMIYGICCGKRSVRGIESISETQFQHIMELFCEQFTYALCGDQIQTMDARNLKLSCEIEINNAPSCLVGYSDVFLTSSNSLSVSKALKAMIELKAPLKLKGGDFFAVRHQVVAQLLMYQSMLRSYPIKDRHIKPSFEGAGGLKEECDTATTQYVTKAAAFDGFAMEAFFAVDGPIGLSSDPMDSQESGDSEPSVVLTQRVSDAAQCLDLLLFLLHDVSMNDVRKIAADDICAETIDADAIISNDVDAHPFGDSIRSGGRDTTGLTMPEKGGKGGKGGRHLKRTILGELTAFHLNSPSRIY